MEIIELKYRAVLDYLNRYNRVRRHGGIGWVTPAERYLREVRFYKSRTYVLTTKADRCDVTLHLIIF